MDNTSFYQIKNNIFAKEFIQAEQLIISYEKTTPKDFDLLILKTLFYFYKNDIERSLIFAKQAIKKNRLNLEANLNLAIIYESQQNYLESYRYYSYLYSLQENFKQEIVKQDDLLTIINNTINQMTEHLYNLKGEEYQTYFNDMKSINQVEMTLNSNMFIEMDDINYYFGTHRLFHTDYFFARYDDWFHSYLEPNKSMNGVESKVEIMKICSYGTNFIYDGEEPCLLPCVLNIDKNMNQLNIVNKDGEETQIVETINNTFSYFKLDGYTRIKAKDPIAFGQPIVLKQSPKLKKLVLTIFIDSFNEAFLKDYPLHEIMPYTHKFFQEGIICTNAYTGSEFTYPTVPSYWTGMRSNRHKMLNSNLHFDIPSDIKLISEHFHQAGYFTSKIGGNCSAVPNHGYLKGTDRYVFERYQQNFNVQQVVSEAIEHMETYYETNQFVWLEIEDLHDVAGGWQRSSSVQRKAGYASREIDNWGGSTLYQTFSSNKRNIYKEELRHIDLYLNNVYQYIRDHYKKDEIVVTLISDHGNGFNVRDGQPFLSDQRMRIPMMFYCDWQGGNVCDEIVETIDYMSILSNLAGVEISSGGKIDGQLPKFFGGNNKKEYAVSQSIFPNKPYVASIFTEEHKFYLETVNPSSSDLRIDFSKLNYFLYDLEDKKLEDEEAVQSYLKILDDLIEDFKLYQ